MPTWNEIDREISDAVSGGEQSSVACDRIRKSYLEKLSGEVEKPVIAYYSGFLQKSPHPESAITDFDMNGFMAVVHNLPRDKGLDLLLHTPGGGTEATRALVEYLYSIFGSNIRVIVPQLAMSAGTMIACASKEIVMGKHSSLGPTDPQVNGVPAMGVIHEIETALEEIAKNPAKQIVWREVFSKFPPAFISNCERSIEGTREMVRTWLIDNMFRGKEKPFELANEVVDQLMNFQKTTEHGHHFLKDKCRKIGLNITDLEESQDLQECVLSVHHCYVASFARVRSIKFIENSIGSSWNVAE
jgi:serine dehydrogenase proteinase